MLRKKGLDVYDYTLLQEKGFMKKEEDKKMSGKVTKDGYKSSFVLGFDGKRRIGLKELYKRKGK